MTTSWTATPKWLTPVPNDDDREFWEGAGRGELRIQKCRSCGLHQHYPRIVCTHCGTMEALDFVTASGNGVIYSFTVIRQNGLPPFAERVPFVVATIDLDEPGARILAALPAAPIDQVRIGMRVRATFRSAAPASDESAGAALGFVDFTIVES